MHADAQEAKVKQQWSEALGGEQDGASVACAVDRRPAKPRSAPQRKEGRASWVQTGTPVKAMGGVVPLRQRQGL